MRRTSLSLWLLLASVTSYGCAAQVDDEAATDEDEVETLEQGLTNKFYPNVSKWQRFGTRNGLDGFISTTNQAAIVQLQNNTGANKRLSLVIAPFCTGNGELNSFPVYPNQLLAAGKSITTSASCPQGYKLNYVNIADR